MFKLIKNIVTTCYVLGRKCLCGTWRRLYGSSIRHLVCRNMLNLYEVGTKFMILGMN